MNGPSFSKLLAKQQKSKLSLKNFCTQEGIEPHIFRYWKKKLINSSPPNINSTENPFIEVPNIKLSTEVEFEPFECISPSGFRILIPQKFNSSNLQKLFATLP